MVPIEFKPNGNDLAKVLHFYGLLSGEGVFKIVCPFHEDINPSCLINVNDGNFYCFGCGAGGNAFDFVKLANKKLDDLQALIAYFKILKSKEVRGIKISKKALAKPKTDLQLMVEAEDYYFNLKTINWVKEDCFERKYMAERGFSPHSLNKCKAKLTYNDSYPIIFPMFDMGAFKGWVCRTTNKRIEKKRKYLYNKGFSRKDTLVGRYDAKTVVLVEGYMDWLKMKQFGVKKVAAILGWKITEAQILKLKEQGVERIISALDDDKCGKLGTKHLEKFFKVRRFKFPKGASDPGDMTAEQFAEAKNKTLGRG